MMKRWVILTGVAVALFTAPARAETDALIEGAKRCTAYLPRYEREYGIPTHLLSAIATTETGRYHEGLKIRIPWPWTINANGKGYIFDTKSEAIAAVRRLRARGIQSIDVGCMQVNLYHHPDAFASLDQAFDPQANIAYAAGFLRSLYDADGSWKKAAADYHSKTPWLGRKYVSEVYYSWYQIIDKLRAARLQVPESSIVAMNKLKPVARMRHGHEVKLAAYHPPHYNHIRVSSQSDAGQNQNDVIVVAPDIKVVADNTPVTAAPQYTPEITVAPAKQVPLTVDTPPSQAAPDAQLIRIGDQTMIQSTDAVSRKNGPNFIFND